MKYLSYCTFVFLALLCLSSCIKSNNSSLKEMPIKYNHYGWMGKLTNSYNGELIIRDIDNGKKYIYTQVEDTQIVYKLSQINDTTLLFVNEPLSFLDSFYIEVSSEEFRIDIFNQSIRNKNDLGENYYFNQNYGLILKHDVEWNYYISIERKDLKYSSTLSKTVINHIESVRNIILD